MKHLSLYLAFALLFLAGSAEARFANPPGAGGTPHAPTRPPALRAQCLPGSSDIDLNINNVRARLRNGGDKWWDGQRARYIVPNVAPGEIEVSSLFAGGIWLGAVDQNQNLIVAAATFRNSGDDFWPGPLYQTNLSIPGFTDDATCASWDRHFKVSGDNIRSLREDVLLDGSVDGIPADDILYWPARGNANFAQRYGFNLPDQDLAPFVDRSGDGIYDPYDGDHPVIEVRGCEERNTYDNPVFGDEMIWWVFNDAGNIHGESGGDPMYMEVQVTAFAYRTSDEINNMTFYRYKLLNKRSVFVDSTHFSVWSDPDLGCATDDYIGCNTDTLPGKTRGRDLGIVYNQDANDNRTGCCGGGIDDCPGYGTVIPALGVDYFRGPLGNGDDSSSVDYYIIDPVNLDTIDTIYNKKEIGLSSFLYYYRGDVAPQNGMGDPNNAAQYFRYQTGNWSDGTPFTAGGNAYGGTEPTKFVFPDDPSEQAGWSMCSEGLQGSDLRFLHTSGPFRLLPGAVNELITGVVWIPDHINGAACAPFLPLLRADDAAQALFDNCFKLLEGPDAPDMEIVELQNELVIALKCQNPRRCALEYEEIESRAPLTPGVDNTYNLEGYKIYQLENENVSVADLDDPQKARVIFQTDVKNGVTKIINWAFDNETEAWLPEIRVDGADAGLRTTFRVTQDQFAQANKTLVNHRKYYFLCVAYAYNNFDPFSLEFPTETQRAPYLQGRRTSTATGIPHPVDPEFFGVLTQSSFGDGPEITRLDGRGNDNGFLDIKNYEAVEAEVIATNKAGEITYEAGRGPVSITVHNPLRVPSARFRMTIFDQNMSNGQLLNNDSIYWRIQDLSGSLPDVVSTNQLTTDIDQAILELGITIKAVQKGLPGSDRSDPSGFFLGSEIEYRDPATANWYFPVNDVSFPFLGEFANSFNFLSTSAGEGDVNMDPKERFSEFSPNGFYPMPLCDCRFYQQDPTFGRAAYLTPNFLEISGGSEEPNQTCRFMRGTTGFTNPDSVNLPGSYGRLRNVNVVMTPDQSKWSRCIVVETASPYYTVATGGGVGLGLGNPNGASVAMLDVKNLPALDINGNVDPSLPNGYSWFPGYAYDVETGERLEMFFGENSVFSNGTSIWTNDTYNGNDMRYNPSDVLFEDQDQFEGPSAFSEILLGGGHYIYVTDMSYTQGDSIYFLYKQSTPVAARKRKALDRVTWASMGQMSTGFNMANGVPPSEAVFKLRINRTFNRFVGTNQNDGYPQYEFDLTGLGTKVEQQEVAVSALDLINIVPNPYYAYSDYEGNETQQYIKITNLPPRCDINIYSLDGRKVRTFKRALMDQPVLRYEPIGDGTDNAPYINDLQIESQIETAQIWDLKNEFGVPIAGGVYIVHVAVPGVGEKTVKAFVITRAFDSQRF